MSQRLVLQTKPAYGQGRALGARRRRLEVVGGRWRAAKFLSGRNGAAAAFARDALPDAEWVAQRMGVGWEGAMRPLAATRGGLLGCGGARKVQRERRLRGSGGIVRGDLRVDLRAAG